MPSGPAPAPTWYLLVELDLPGLTGYRQRAIGPLSWTDVRALGARWERAFGTGTTEFTEQPGPMARRVAVGAREPAAAVVVRNRAAAVPVRTSAPRPERPTAAPAPRAPRSKPVLVPTARRRAPGPSRLTARARAAMTRTRAAQAAIDARIAGVEL
jgi:hypothetical protein